MVRKGKAGKEKGKVVTKDVKGKGCQEGREGEKVCQERREGERCCQEGSERVVRKGGKGERNARKVEKGKGLLGREGN